MDAGEEHRQLAIAVAQQALGALQHVSPTLMLATIGGRRVEVILSSAHGGLGSGRHMGSLPNRALELRVPLSLPSRVVVQSRSGYVHVGPLPMITTGDPAFDAAYVVVGVPSEVLQSALDASTRAWIRQDEHRMLRTDEAGAISFVSAVKLPRENPRRPLTPQALGEAANTLCHFANTFEATYRNRRAEIVAQQGEAGALAWEEHNRQLIAVQPLRWVRWVLGGCLVVVVLGVLATILLAVLLAVGSRDDLVHRGITHAALPATSGLSA